MSTDNTTLTNANIISPTEEVEMDATLELELFGSPDDEGITSAYLESFFAAAAASPTSNPPTPIDGRDYVDDMNDPSLIGKYSVSNLVKTDRMRDLEAQKAEKLAKREMALKGRVRSKTGEKLVKTESGAQKRKRSLGSDVEGETEAKKIRAGVEGVEMGTKKKVPAPETAEKGKEPLKQSEKTGMIAVNTVAQATATPVAENKQTIPMPQQSSKQKRKRSADDEGEELQVTKRLLTDAKAAEIAQQHLDPSLKDRRQENKRRDSVTETEAAATTGDGVGKKLAPEEEEGKHLAPVKQSDGGTNSDPNDLTIYQDDDEMTRMLKTELARQCIIPEKDNEEPEDPRVEQALAPLNETEKKRVAVEFLKRERKGCELPDLAGLQAAVRVMIKLREKRGLVEENKPVVSSPLAREGVSAGDYKNCVNGKGSKAGKDGERKVLKSKEKLGAPANDHAHVIHATRDAHTTASAPRPSSATTTVLFPYTMDPTDWAVLSLPLLKTNCRDRGLAVSGSKSVLVRRLEEYEKAFREGKTPRTGDGKGKKSKTRGY